MALPSRRRVQMPIQFATLRVFARPDNPSQSGAGLCAPDTTDARLSQSVRVLMGVEDFIMLLLQLIYSRISLNGCITPPPCSVESHVCPDQRFQQMRSRPRGQPEPLLVKCPYAQAKKEIRNKLQKSLIRANAPV